MKLTSEQKTFWKENGHLVVENVIPPDLIKAERKRFDWWCQHWDSPEAKALNVEHESNQPRETWNNQTIRKIHKLE